MKVLLFSCEIYLAFLRRLRIFVPEADADGNLQIPNP
jgi:hypothetical protein